MRFQLGNLAEWAAAIGTSAAVLLTAFVIRAERREKREQEALRVVPSVGPTAGLVPDPEGRVTTEMLVTVNNGGIRAIRNVKVSVFRSDLVQSWQYMEIPPLGSEAKRLTPTEGDFAKYNSGQVFDVAVQAIFTDADGKRWLRNSQGVIRRVKG